MTPISKTISNLNYLTCRSNSCPKNSINPPASFETIVGSIKNILRWNVEWVLIEKLSAMCGLSRKAIYNYIYRNVWTEGVHYVKRNNRLYFHIPSICNWITGSL